MVEAPSIEDLRIALEPVEALRGEHSQLETWVLDAIASLESMHVDLAEWQRDLTRRQAALDQREAAVWDGESTGIAPGGDASQMELQLTASREELRQLEDENADQLLAIDDLDRQLVAAQAELRLLRKQTEELTVALETERARNTDEHRLWTGELREMRRLLERQGEALAWLTGVEPGDDLSEDVHITPAPRDDANGDEPESGDSTTRAAELRRRASSRRAAHRRP